MDVRQEIRYAIRSLARNKAVAAPCVLTLGLGIGITSAVCSLVYGVLARPLPYPEPGNLVRLSEYHSGAESVMRDAMLSNLTFDAWEQQSRTLEGLAAYAERAYTVSGGEGAERVSAEAVSPALFSLLGVLPAAGRFFDPGEAREGADGVVVLSHEYWQQRFGSSAGVIGRTITLDDRPRTIIGVAPPGFSFPDPGRRLYTPYLMPQQAAGTGADVPVRVFFAVGRLKPGVTASQAAAEGTAVSRGLGPRPVSADLLFGKGGPVTIRVRTLTEETTAAVRPILMLMTFGTVLVLLIGCANVSNLLLTRGLTRARELTIRAALGAGRDQVIRLVLTESYVLSWTACVCGLFLAWISIRLWPAFAPPSFPRVQDVRLDWRTLLFAFAVSFIAGNVSSFVPALRGVKLDLASALRESAGTSPTGGSAFVRRGLIVLEAALAVLLLIGASLLTRSFQRLIHIETGYDAKNVVTARISFQGSTPERWQQLATAVLQRVQAMPSVEAAGASSMAPLGDTNAVVGFRLSGDRPVPLIARALGYVVTPGYTQALRLKLRQGRLLTEMDATSKTQAIVVNEQFVKAYLNNGQPVLGRRYTNMLTPNGVTEIVGVVGNVLKNGLRDTPRAEFYVALGNEGAINTGREINLVVRTTGDPRGVAASLRDVMRDVDRNIAIYNINVLATEISRTAGEPRFATFTMGVFAMLAVTLASVGLYGMLAYSVACRRREIGIRMALGSQRGRIFALVVREGMTVMYTGLLVGLALSMALTRLIRSLLFGVDALDALSFLAASSALIVVSLLACAVPAWRASSVDPLRAIREA